MTPAMKIIDTHKLSIQPKLSEIERIQKSINDSKSRLVKKFLDIFIASPISDLYEIEKAIGAKLVEKLIIQVANARPLTSSDIDDHHLLWRIERMGEANKEKFSNIFEPQFDALSDKYKFKVATFCSGITHVFEAYPFIRKWLSDEFSLIDYCRCETGAHVEIGSGYNSEHSQSLAQITLHKDKFDDLPDFADTLLRIIDLGYKSGFFPLMDHSLSLHCSYSVQIHRSNSGSLSGFSLYQGRYADEVKFGGTPREQLLKLLEYCSKHHWYRGDSYDD